MRIAVFGLWHLGCVTAACLAEAGHHVAGLDEDAERVEGLSRGRAPLREPGLDESIQSGLKNRLLTFTRDADAALRDAEILWVTFDTPVDENDEADVAAVRQAVLRIADAIRPGTIVLISSQVPVGFTRTLEQELAGRDLRFAYSPENLRLGKALEVFRKQERILLGVRDRGDRPKLEALLAPFCESIEWMSVESAEMTKHALNAFLATSVTFINEISRLCEVMGANSKEVERGLKSEARIGPKAYLAPGSAFAGGTLARDIRYLLGFGARHRTATPLFQGVWDSNQCQKEWLRTQVERMIDGVNKPVVAVLGLTYKPGTSTLRRSTSIELCQWLRARGIDVRAHDPAVTELPADLGAVAQLGATPADCLAGADVAVVATEWPEYRGLAIEDFVQAMRRPCVIDQNWFLAQVLSKDNRVTYVATGQAPPLTGQGSRRLAG